MKNSKLIYGLVVMLLLFVSSISTANVDPLPLEQQGLHCENGPLGVAGVEGHGVNLDAFVLDDVILTKSNTCITAENHSGNTYTIDTRIGRPFYKEKCVDTYDFQIEAIPIQRTKLDPQLQTVDDSVTCYLLSLLGIECKEIVEEEVEGF